MAIGYPKALVCSQIDRAQNSRPTTSTGTNNIIPLVTTYHPGLHKLNNLLKTGFPILQSFTTTQLVSKEPPKIRAHSPDGSPVIGMVRRHGVGLLGVDLGQRRWGLGPLILGQDLVVQLQQ
uniref:Uncharacterized protein n=1 Tax=Timema monikensis TaxID=170555 RepID=A0A7R9HP74_9NEOP|nr:unnamed protein product [Timema monikensis]